MPEIDIQKELDNIHSEISRLNTNIVQLGLDLLKAIEDIEQLKIDRIKQEKKIKKLNKELKNKELNKIYGSRK